MADGGGVVGGASEEAPASAPAPRGRKRAKGPNPLSVMPPKRRRQRAAAAASVRGGGASPGHSRTAADLGAGDRTRPRAARSRKRRSERGGGRGERARRRRRALRQCRRRRCTSSDAPSGWGRQDGPSGGPAPGLAPLVTRGQRSVSLYSPMRRRTRSKLDPPSSVAARSDEPCSDPVGRSRSALPRSLLERWAPGRGAERAMAACACCRSTSTTVGDRRSIVRGSGPATACAGGLRAGLASWWAHSRTAGQLENDNFRQAAAPRHTAAAMTEQQSFKGIYLVGQGKVRRGGGGTRARPRADPGAAPSNRACSFCARPT